MRVALLLLASCAVIAGPPSAAGTAAGNGVPAAMSLAQLPYRMDASNQAGWWKPMDELGGVLYLAYNAYGGPGLSGGGGNDTHTVYVARRGLAAPHTRALYLGMFRT